MIARPKMSQNEWKATEIRASKVGNFSPFSCPGDELRQLMHTIASGDVKFFPPGDPAYNQAACVAYKFKCLEDLQKKGILTEEVLKEKRNKVIARHKGLMSPRLREHDPEDHELDFVIDKIDVNHDNKISKDECLAALGIWMQVMKDAPAHEALPKDKSHACALM